MSNYESPINVISSALRTEVEKSILKAVKDVAVYVDKDELIKALKYDRNQYEKGFSDATHKWIPVSERLPEPFTVVMVTLKSGSVREAFFDNEDGFTRFDFQGLTQLDIPNPPIAWMPLPEAYKDGEQK